MLDMPRNFSEYPDARKSGFIKVKELKESGVPVVGVFCSYTPSELIRAVGAVTVGLCGTSDETVTIAEADLPKNLCPLIKSSYGFFASDTCPYFYFSDLLVGETTCDGKKKMYEIMGEKKDTYVLHLPQGNELESEKTMWLEEMKRFKAKLEEKFNVEITDEMLRNEIKKGNRERRILIEYYELGKLNPSPINGTDINGTLEALGFQFDREAQCDYIEEETKRLREVYENELKGKVTGRPRIMVTGCPASGVREKLLKQIEDLGADIVTYENCGGVREKQTPIDENKDPLEAIAEKYLKVSCSVMTPNKGRLKDIETLCREYQVDAVIEVVLQACHTFNVESYYVKKFVQEELELPYLFIETDYSKNDFGQINTRIAAFLEMVEVHTPQLQEH